MRYAVAHGRRSGRGGAAALGAEAVARLRTAGHDVLEIEAGSLDEARARCRAAVTGGVDVLAVAGGDGAVSLATDLCAGTGTAVGILPAGTGNDNARSLGVRQQSAQAKLLLASVVLAAIATAAAGPVGFVALAAPQVAMRLVRSAGPPIIASGLTGAVLVVGSDVIARTVLPVELPVGIVTSALGGPFLLYLLVRNNRKVSA